MTLREEILAGESADKNGCDAGRAQDAWHKASGTEANCGEEPRNIDAYLVRFVNSGPGRTSR